MLFKLLGAQYLGKPNGQIIGCGGLEPSLEVYTYAHRPASAYSLMMMISDATILVFGIRYDIDTILPKYRDIDTISIFCQ